VSLPAEQLTLAGFAQGNESDTMAPGGLLAVVQTVTGEDGSGLALCSDDQLAGIISAARRLESRAAWTLMAALAEFAARRPADTGLGGGGPAEFAADELACELHVTPLSAAGQIRQATAVTTRLPRTFAALHAGRIHPVHVWIIEDETSILSPGDAARADEILAQLAPGMTFGELRYAAHKLVLSLDPEAARKRKEAGRRTADVRPFREPSGNAGMIARELPCDEVLASWQHIEQRALDLRAAGVPGTLEELRVRAYLDLLQEHDTRQHTANPADPSAESPGGPQDGPGDPGTPEDSPSGPGPSGSSRSASGAGPGLAALVNITVPLATVRGQSETPGEASGLGPLDGQDSRAVAAAAARDPRTRWCLTALHPDGTAAAHACLPGRHPPPGLLTPGPDPPRPAITWTPVTRGPCGHPHAETGYRPSRALRHLITARNTRCTAPGCRRAAARCDLDHTIAWDHGGLTCECDLAPLCRHHHRAKQADGWHLDQPEPGTLVWRVPSGRTYTTTPTQYAI
jgi:hypothetical protein